MTPSGVGARTVAIAEFDPNTSRALRWFRTAEAPAAFELRDGDAPVAVLRFARREGSLAEVAVRGATWTLKRIGFVHPQVTVRVAGGEPAPVARLTVHWRRSLLERAGQPPIFLERAGWAPPAWEVRSASGERLYHIEPVAESGRLAGGLVEIDPPGRQGTDLLPLVTAWYYAALGWAEEEVVAATTSVLTKIS